MATPQVYQSDRRRALRVRYREGNPRPQLKLVSGEYPVVDLSQSGVKFAVKGASGFSAGQRVVANLVFPNSLGHDIAGTVLRIDSDGIVVKLDLPVPVEYLNQSARDRRAFFRLRYPYLARPSLQLLGEQFEITEISEHGVRLYPYDLTAFTIGEPLAAVLLFLDGETLPVEGHVYRFDRGEVVIRLTKGIPEGRVMQEQRNLIRKFQTQ